MRRNLAEIKMRCRIPLLQIPALQASIGVLRDCFHVNIRRTRPKADDVRRIRPAPCGGLPWSACRSPRNR
jgi:hypothetical protein